MRYLLTLSLILLLAAAGCKKKEEGPVTSGKVTINSKLYETGTYYYSIGYSFSQGKLVQSNTTPGPDVVVDEQTTPDNTAIEWVYLGTDNYQNSFHLNGSFNSLSEAEDFFNNYLTVPDTIGYSGIAKDIKPYQVWTFRTRDMNYAKMLILDVSSEIQKGDPYSETTFRFVYQPDGSRTFPK